jgi:F-type H+-transporting ATPase subunit epsilon
MASTGFELVSPRGTLYEGRARMIACRSIEGQIAFLADHMPYVGALAPSVVRVVGPIDGDGEEGGPDIWLAVRGGLVEVNHNQVVMLADEAEMGRHIDAAAASSEVVEAEARAAAAAGSPEAEGAEEHLAWARARLEASEGSALPR